MEDDYLNSQAILEIINKNQEKSLVHGMNNIVMGNLLHKANISLYEDVSDMLLDEQQDVENVKIFLDVARAVKIFEERMLLLMKIFLIKF